MTSNEDKSTEELARLYVQSFLNDTPQWLNVEYEGERDYKHLFNMLEKHPKLITQHFDDSDGTMARPLTYLLAAHAPLDIVQKIHQMNPDSISTSDDLGLFPLHEAALYNCSYEVIEFLLEKFPQAVKKRALDQFPLEFLPSRLRQSDFNSQEFCKIFQLLYNAHPTNKWPDAVRAGEGLPLTINDNYLNGLLPALMQQRKTPATLLSWLAKKEMSTVVNVSFFGNSSATFDPEALAANLGHFVPLLPNCKKFCLDGSDAELEYTFFQHLFSSAKIPPTIFVVISGFDIFLPPRQSNLSANVSSCRITQLGIVRNKMTREAVYNLLQTLQALPNLMRLFFFPRQKGDAPIQSGTASVIELLETAPKLDLLSIIGDQLGIDVQVLSRALQETKKATAFVVCQKPQGRHEPLVNAGIAYHSAMNHHGRLQISAPGATLATLVDCLCSVHGHGSNSDQVISPNLQQSVWYGLLHQAPGMWANSAMELGPNKKRPLAVEKTESKLVKRQK